MSNDDKALAFFGLVGRSITMWADVERKLFEFCRFCLNTSDEKTAAVFYRFNTIRDRLELTERLMRCSLTETRYQEWKNIYAEIGRLVPFRNDIAHNPVVFVREIGTKERPILITPHTDILIHQWDDAWWSIQTERAKLHYANRKVEIKETDLSVHIEATRKLLKTMLDLQRRLPKRPLKKPPALVSPKAQRPPRSKKKYPRTRSKPKRPPQSSPE